MLPFVLAALMGVLSSSIRAEVVISEPDAASAPRILHEQITCLVKARPARIEARIEPDIPDVRARVFFRESAAAHWYWVEMQRLDSHWVGILPPPASDAWWVAYVIEARLGEAGPRTRLPDPPTWIAEVAPETSCAQGRTASAAEAKDIVASRLPQAPRSIPGFQLRAALVGTEVDVPPLPVRSLGDSGEATKPSVQEATPSIVAPQSDMAPEGVPAVPYRISHRPSACLAPWRSPLIEAQIEPDSADLEARVFFRAADAPWWTWVAMSRQDGSWTAVLPEPSLSARRVDYALEVRYAGKGRSVLSDLFSVAVTSTPCAGGSNARTVRAESVTVYVPDADPKGSSDRRSARKPAALLNGFLVGDKVVLIRSHESMPVLPDPSRLDPIGSVGPGSTVRVRTLSADEIVGKLVSFDDETLVLAVAHGSNRTVPRRDVVALDALEQGRGRSVAKGAAIGAAIGAGAGIALQLFLCLPGDAHASTCDSLPVIGVATGALLGVNIGGASEKRRWRPIDVAQINRSTRLQLWVDPARKGGGVGLAFGF